MVYELAKTSQFKASLKRAKKRGLKDKDVLILTLVDTERIAIFSRNRSL